MDFVAIGNDELKGKAGKTTKCPYCLKKHKIEFGIDTRTKKISKMLGFVHCGKDSYLVSVNGKLI